MARRGALALGIGLVLAVFAAPALAVEGEENSPFHRAVEESGVKPPPPQRFSLPEGKLKITPSALLAARPGQRLHFSVVLSDTVPGATLTVRLPRRWVSVPASGIRAIRAPRLAGRARHRARVRRSGRIVKLTLERTAAGQTASFDIVDAGIPAGTYRLPFSWRDEDGRLTRAGAARVRFYAPSREGPARDNRWARLGGSRLANNASADTIEESETFVAATPSNSDRVAVGSNWSNASMPAWVSTDGGGTWLQRTLPQTIDKPGSSTNESGDVCCDPMFAADSLGNIWFGGLTFKMGSAASRIVVNRIASGTTSFQTVTAGLPVRTSGTQDKPMMTIDDTATSPTYGRLYVVWDEPASGGVNVVMSQCDTRVSGVAQPQRCDNADNWSAPVSVTPSGGGSYIYADVAVGPDGRIYVVWWDYSNVNAIRGDVCNPSSQNCAAASSWGSPQTISVLDSTGSTPLPFECPILAQPGGRASTSSQVDVDHSGGPNDGRVYVTWSDLRTGSGTTKCADDGTHPLATNLTFDSFVASAAGGALPGGADTSANVGTRLISDGEGGGQSNSDDWFAWLAVDQSNGQAWADLYSTRDDAARKKTNFYQRSVTPSGGGHTLGALTKVSSAQSDYSANPCCNFGNDYGDYTGIAAAQGVVYPVWTDTSTGEGDVFTSTSAPEPSATTNPATSVAATTATLNGTVNPRGSATTYHFDYGTFPGSYTEQTSEQSAGSGNSNVAVSAPVSGLSPGQTYYFRVVATNGSGSTNGSELSFKTVAPPTATTASPTNVSQTSATLKGTVNPMGGATSYHFEYGSSPGSYTSQTPDQNLSAGTSDVAVSAGVTGLSPSTTYYYRVVATNDADTTTGAEISFTTTANPLAPAVATRGASAIGQTGATLNGSVNPRGSSTTAHFEYGTSSASLTSSTPSQDVGSGATDQTVSAPVTGLVPGTSYFFRIVADNDGGPAQGSTLSFTTTALPAPTVATGAATLVGQTTATVAGSVNPNGLPTTWRFQYGKTAAYGSSTPVDTRSGSSAQAVSEQLQFLSSATTYHYRLTATNSSGTRAGVDRTFKTSSVFSVFSPPADVIGPKLSVSRRRVRLGRGRRLRVRVRCAATEPEPCRGKLRLYTGRRKRRIASARFSIAPGKTVRVRLKLSRRGARLLRRAHRLRVLGVAEARDSAGNLGRKRVRFTLLPRRR